MRRSSYSSHFLSAGVATSFWIRESFRSRSLAGCPTNHLNRFRFLAPRYDNQQREKGVQYGGRPQQRPDPFAADGKIEKVKRSERVVCQHSTECSAARQAGDA